MPDQTTVDSERAHQTPAAASSPKALPLRRLWWAAILLLGLSVGAVGFTI
jgi:hypothetical protein